MSADPEQKKYARLYHNRHTRYGHKCHGKNAMGLLPEPPLRILDVGCGWNEWAVEMRAKGYDALGVDFACPGADEQLSVFDLKDRFGHCSFDWVTCFDMLEHLHPDTLEDALDNLQHVAARFIVSMGTFHHGQYHLIVKPMAWWLEKMAERSVCALVGASHGSGRREPYVMGQWSAETL